MSKRTVRLSFTLATASILAGCGLSPSPGEDPGALPAETLAPPAARYAAAADQIQQRARDLIVDENLPGVSIAVAVDGELAWAEALGWSNLEERVPLTPRMRFRIGGVSQSLTAAAVGLLVERGLLDLDAPVSDYLPTLPDGHGRVTTRQLLGHVAGFGHYGGGENGQVNPDDGLAFAHRTCAVASDAIDIVAGDRLRFEPGTAFRYSSYGWVLVSVLVEAVAGEPFADFMAREVFAPVGMSDTLLDAPVGSLRGHGQTVPGRAGLYFPAFAMRSRYGLHDAPNIDHTCLMGADGFVSTPSDLVRFGAALSRGDVLEPATAELLQTQAQLASGESTGYGLGWFVRRVPLDDAEARVIGHGGSAVGGSTSFMAFPDHDLVVAVSSNVSFAEDAVRSLALATAAVFAGRE